MLKGDSKKDGKKSIGLISKNKTTLRHGAHSFVHFFAIVFHDYNVTLPVTCFMEEMSYVLMPVFFFHCRLFSYFFLKLKYKLSIVIIASNVSCLVLFFVNNCDFLLR